MPFVIAAAALILLYIVFIVGPSIVAFHFIFSRMTSVKLDDVSKADSRYTPFIPAMIEGRDFIAAKGPEEVEIKSSDGLTLAADYVDRGSDRTAIFLHGYHSDAGVNFPIQGKMFWEEGFNLILVDQRAHARSGGNRSTLGVLEGGDAVKWCEYAVSRGADKIVLYGLSMGASALTLAADRFDPETVRTLVVDCGFASPYEQLICECKRRKLPWRLMMFWIRLAAKISLGIDIKKSSTETLTKTRVPVFFIHGTADATVPVEQSIRNYEACAAAKDIFLTEGAAHTVAFPAGGERAKDAMFSFINKNL
ncbi:MAG: alpha/beta hydrolase [Clostridia bacterium]|nr:alpha/beta hydrolase [Clostridia bacterium]MBQ6676717.1 alpha/beta hydrolase [Clostridia bacterium]